MNVVFDIMDNNMRNKVRKFIWGVTEENVGVAINKIGIFIYGNPGDRIRIYLDDLKLEGTIPTAASYASELVARWAPYSSTFSAKMDEFDASYMSVQNKIDNLPIYLSTFEQKLKAEAQERLDIIDADYDLTAIRNNGLLTVDEYSNIEYRLQQGGGIVDGISMARNSAITRINHLMYNAFTTRKNIQDILPDADYICSNIDNEICITATPGEYEPASFVIETFSDLIDLSVAITDLTSNGGGTIASSDINIRTVKCWFQNGKDNITNGQKVLVPELLLKDDSLVKVENENNYLKISGNYILISDPNGISGVSNAPTNSEFPVEDSSTLSSLTILNNKLKQFWLTVKVPDEAVGKYTGYITFTTTGGREIGKYKISVNVLPFTLENSSLKYSIYYTGVTKSDTTGSISSSYKTTDQYTAEMNNLLSHGVTNPTMYQSYSHLTLVGNELAIRTNLGMNENSLYYLGLFTGNSTNQVELATLKNKVTTLSEVTANYGITNNYIYGMDEAKTDDLLKQREAWEAVHEAGGKIFVAGRSGDLELEYPWGKIGNWHFDETEGLTASDSAGNNGTLNNMDQSTCWVSGQVGNALSFDGVDDYVDCGTNSSLSFEDGEEWTFEAWLKPDTNDGWQAFTGVSGIDYKYLMLHDGDKIYFKAKNYNYYYVNIGSYGGDWLHIAVVTDSSGNMTVYRDGEYKGVMTPFSTEMDFNHIGSNGSISRKFKGLIDEVRSFSRVLSEDEIEKEYYYGSEGTYQIVGDLKDLHVCASLLSYTEENICHEVSGNKIFSYANPQVGVEDPEIYRRNYGLRLWKYGYDGTMDFAYHYSFNNIWNDFYNITYKDHNFTYPTINGVIDTIAWEGFREAVDDTRYIATLSKAIEESPASQAKTDAVNFIDNLKETNRLEYDDLSEIRKDIIDHILKLWGPIGNWHFDEEVGLTANDSSNSNNGTLTNMDQTSCWVSGQVGNALSFDGVDDYVDCGTDSSLSFADGDEWTFEAWLKPDSNTGWQAFTGVSGIDYKYLMLHDGDKIYFKAKNYNYYYVNIGSYGGDWLHITVVTDSSGNMTVYRDGEYKGVMTPFSTEMDFNHIGSNGSISRKFKGLIDEVIIFPRVLHEDEIEKEGQGWN
jgi:Concanavalin A-like lectin/glucanases superfamily